MSVPKTQRAAIIARPSVDFAILSRSLRCVSSRGVVGIHVDRSVGGRRLSSGNPDGGCDRLRGASVAVVKPCPSRKLNAPRLSRDRRSISQFYHARFGAFRTAMWPTFSSIDQCTDVGRRLSSGRPKRRFRRTTRRVGSGGEGRRVLAARRRRRVIRRDVESGHRRRGLGGNDSGCSSHRRTRGEREEDVVRRTG